MEKRHGYGRPGSNDPPVSVVLVECGQILLGRLCFFGLSDLDIGYGFYRIAIFIEYGYIQSVIVVRVSFIFVQSSQVVV